MHWLVEEVGFSALRLLSIRQYCWQGFRRFYTDIAVLNQHPCSLLLVNVGLSLCNVGPLNACSLLTFRLRRATVYRYRVLKRYRSDLWLMHYLVCIGMLVLQYHILLLLSRLTFKCGRYVTGYFRKLFACFPANYSLLFPYLFAQNGCTQALKTEMQLTVAQSLHVKKHEKCKHIRRDFDRSRFGLVRFGSEP